MKNLRNKISKILCTLAFCIIFPPFSANAQSSQDQAREMMVRTGKWIPSSIGTDGSSWNVDPYSIFKLSDRRFHINVMVVNASNQYEPSQTFTYEVDCGRGRIRVAGFRTNGIFQEYKELFGLISRFPWIDAEDGTHADSITGFVCPFASSSGTMILISSGISNGHLVAFSAIENVVFQSSNNQNLRYVENNARGDRFYGNCATRAVMEVDSQGSVLWEETVFTAPSPGRVIVDWMCDGLHPETRVVVRNFDWPTAQHPQAAPQNGEIRDATDLGPAMDRCEELGFVRGTEPFGECVLRVSE